MASDLPAQPPRFFVLEKLNEGEHDTEFDTVDPRLGPPLHHCPQCGDPIGSLSWQPPHRGILELYGRAYGDLVKLDSGGLLVTERFAEDFKAEGLTGLIGFHPVEVVRVRRKRRGPKPGPPPRYLLVNPSYGHAALDMERSRIKGSRPLKCTWCRYVGIDAVDGFVLEEGSWTGEDIFQPRGTARVMVTERFVRFAERHAMSHIAFVPIEKYVWDPLGLFYPWSTHLKPESKA